MIYTHLNSFTHIIPHHYTITGRGLSSLIPLDEQKLYPQCGQITVRVCCRTPLWMKWSLTQNDTQWHTLWQISSVSGCFTGFFFWRTDTVSGLIFFEIPSAHTQHWQAVRSTFFWESQTALAVYFFKKREIYNKINLWSNKN